MFGLGLRAASHVQLGLTPIRLLSTAAAKSTKTVMSSAAPGLSKSMRPFRYGAMRFNTTKAAAESETALNWNQFLALRLRRRRVNLACSIFTALTGVMIGWGFISNVEIDPTQMILGFDPIMVYSFGLIVCGFAGYLVGPSLGNVVFKTMIRKQYASFLQKNTEFLHHIRKNRPDPSKQSYTNPVVDYYGEKIGSLKDYRRWLRDGRAYRKKLEKFF